MNDYTVLLAVRAPDLSKKEFIPMQVGVVGLYEKYEDARKAQLSMQDKWEFRNYRLMVSFAPLIKTDMDYRWPMGFEIAAN